MKDADLSKVRLRGIEVWITTAVLFLMISIAIDRLAQVSNTALPRGRIQPPARRTKTSAECSPMLSSASLARFLSDYGGYPLRVLAVAAIGSVMARSKRPTKTGRRSLRKSLVALNRSDDWNKKAGNSRYATWAKKSIAEKKRHGERNRGKHWYTNGADEKQFAEGQQPEGWWRGTLTKEQRDAKKGRRQLDNCLEALAIIARECPEQLDSLGPEFRMQAADAARFLPRGALVATGSEDPNGASIYLDLNAICSTPVLPISDRRALLHVWPRGLSYSEKGYRQLRLIQLAAVLPNLDDRFPGTCGLKSANRLWIPPDDENGPAGTLPLVVRPN